jgi:hypothetical protein
VIGRRFRAAPEPDPATRFGSTCPVCGQWLGSTSPPVDRQSGRFAFPPSLRLEIGTGDGSGAVPWRVTCLAGNFPPASSTDPPFNAHEVEFVYLLCGDGHIFPDATPVFHGDGPGARQRIDDWNMVAAIGAPASGKTYLLVRMLQQNLDDLSGWDAGDDAVPLRLHKLSPLEERPLAARVRSWNATRTTGWAIDPTGTDSDATPSGILRYLLGDALEAIKMIIQRTVVGGDSRAAKWGTGFRQPLVVRTDNGGRRTWTGVADLPGELFGEDNASLREVGKLRSFDGLLWVVDPVVAPTATRWLAADNTEQGRQMLDGSLRPGTIQAAGQEARRTGGVRALSDVADLGAEVVRATRESIQDDIGRQITMVDGVYAAHDGRRLQMLVAITKCDLIRAALEKPEMRLCHLGEPDEVERGVASHLAFTVSRWSQGLVGADGEAEALLAYLRASANADQRVRRERAVQVAAGLIEHYSRHEELWKLVHRGQESVVEIGRGAGRSTQPVLIRVPSIDEHLGAASRPGSGALTLPRDLVMSAVGCGVAYALGLQSAVHRMHREPWINLRFFLCSPLTKVPIAVADERLQPLNHGERFPRVDERSAALTQLQLAVLERARR